MTAAPRRCLLALAGALLLSACEQPQLYQQRMVVFGTLVDVTLWGVAERDAADAMQAISERFRDMHRDWHAWQKGALVELNQALAEGRAAEAPPELVSLLRQASELSRRSEGLFNPAIGKLIAAWGFHSSELPKGRAPPPAALLDALVAADPDMGDLEIDGTRVRSRNRSVQVDLGGFAKGYAVDAAVLELRRRGIRNAIVNAGGDLRGIGSKGPLPWRVGVQHPQGAGVLATIELRGDESVFTSGNYARFVEHEGVRYPHIIDPRTGRPVMGVTSVTVIHSNGAEADAAATALVVAGPRDWQRIARAMGIRHVMLVDDSGTVHMNPAMEARVQFQGERPPVALSPELE